MKICSKCNKRKPETEFAIKNSARGTRSGICKSCHRLYAKDNYAKNTARYIAKARKNDAAYIERFTVSVIKYLRLHPCIDCGETDIEVLEFDHIEMIGSAGRRINEFRTHSMSRLIAEFDKCEVRCSNCHTRRTRKQMGWHRIKICA